MTRSTSKFYFKIFITFTILFLTRQHCISSVEALGWFEALSLTNQTTTPTLEGKSPPLPKPSPSEAQRQDSEPQQVADSLLTIGGLKPSSIASLLNTVSDTGFSYFNVHDQCRSRTACDVGYMLYRKLNFLHNWVLRASVRTLVSSSNVYAQSWHTGMMGKNCTLTYPLCNQSPFESIMNFALLSA